MTGIIVIYLKRLDPHINSYDCAPPRLGTLNPSLISDLREIRNNVKESTLDSLFYLKI
jgi:hypothetical protein